MKLFQGKSPEERNKIIAASVLGAMAILVLGYTIVFPIFFGGRKVTVTATTASPTPTAAPRRAGETVSMPSREEVDLTYTTTPINYRPGDYYAPDAGRNIFAFYEPPPPTPYSPTPTPPPLPIETPPTPTPTPTPPLLVGFITPQSVYAGQQTFRLEVNGDKFTPESLIYLNSSQLPTTFISQQKLVADVPSNFISGAGSIQIMVRTADGGLYSNQVSINVQAPPTPQFQYIGMIARQRFNNDTAYFQEQGKPLPISARLNDVVGGRFRLKSISASETIFEDVNLGFEHRIALSRPPQGQTAGSNNQNPNNSSPLQNGGRIPQKGGFNTVNPNPNTLNPNIQPGTVQPCPPGIPCENFQVIQPTPPPKSEKDDEDDDGNG